MCAALEDRPIRDSVIAFARDFIRQALARILRADFFGDARIAPQRDGEIEIGLAPHAEFQAGGRRRRHEREFYSRTTRAEPRRTPSSSVITKPSPSGRR